MRTDDGKIYLLRRDASVADGDWELVSFRGRETRPPWFEQSVSPSKPGQRAGGSAVIYRAPAATCNACPSKPACTDSSHGREIEQNNLSQLEYGMKRFHRAMSLTLVVLSSLILVVELFRTGGLYPRTILALNLTLFCVLIRHLSAKLSQGSQPSPTVPKFERVELVDPAT